MARRRWIDGPMISCWVRRPGIKNICMNEVSLPYTGL
jgi:hypothetical protein